MTCAEQFLHHEYREIGTGEPIESENLVEFRLLYEGALLASGNKNTRPAEKHSIRSTLHPQLRRQWQVNSALRQLAVHLGNQYDPIPLETEQERFEHGVKAIGKKWSMFGYEFVPMITAEHAVRCSLDILLLRPEGKGFIHEQGDIDGQLKTVFDALRLPKSPGQLAGVKPQEDETPFFCLLEDDCLISEVHINSDQLLLLPHQREIKANDAFVIIHVRTNAKTPGAMGNFLA
ncbi:MAG: hypothetical protein ACLQGV_00040 [Bryobacteraceae bacterium]